MRGRSVNVNVSIDMICCPLSLSVQLIALSTAQLSGINRISHDLRFAVRAAVGHREIRGLIFRRFERLTEQLNTLSQATACNR